MSHFGHERCVIYQTVLITSFLANCSSNSMECFYILSTITFWSIAFPVAEGDSKRILLTDPDFATNQQMLHDIEILKRTVDQLKTDGMGLKATISHLQHSMYTVLFHRVYHFRLFFFFVYGFFVFSLFLECILF